MKKYLLSLVLTVSVLLSAASISWAAPNNPNKAEHNPNVTAYYPVGLHAIPTNPITYFVGTNLVSARGNSGQIQAWYTDSSNHGYHSVWNITKNSTCKGDSVYIENAYPAWGEYLVPDADYCVKVNAF